MLHASIDAFKLFEVPGGEAGVVFSIALAVVSLFVPLGVLLVWDRFFGRERSAGGARLVVPRNDGSPASAGLP
jgi:hypothetical protein